MGEEQPQLEKEIKELDDKVSMLVDLMYGKDGQLGVVGRLILVEKKMDDLTKVGWFVASTILGYILLKLLGLL